MARSNRANGPNDDADIQFFKFVSDHWGKITSILGVIAMFFGAGYWIGVKISKIEYETEKNAILNEKDREIMDVREKYMMERIERSESILKSGIGKEVDNNEK